MNTARNTSIPTIIKTAAALAVLALGACNGDAEEVAPGAMAGSSAESSALVELGALPEMQVPDTDNTVPVRVFVFGDPAETSQLSTGVVLLGADAPQDITVKLSPVPANALDQIPASVTVKKGHRSATFDMKTGNWVAPVVVINTSVDGTMGAPGVLQVLK
jgi:hypothetical protein